MPPDPPPPTRSSCILHSTFAPLVFALFFLFSFPQAHGNEAGQVEEGREFYYSAKQHITEHVANNTHDTVNSAKACWLTLCSILLLFQKRFSEMLTSETALQLIVSLAAHSNLTRPTGMQFPSQ